MDQKGTREHSAALRIKQDPDDISLFANVRSDFQPHCAGPHFLHPTVQQAPMFNSDFHRRSPQDFPMHGMGSSLDDSQVVMTDHPSPDSDVQSLDDNDSIFSSASPSDAYDGPLPPHEETEKYLRFTLNIAPPQRVNLTALSEHPWPPGITRMIKLAIWGSQRKMLTLSQIYEEIEKRFPTKRSGKDAPWKKSIRHNLSLKSVFVKIERPANHPGKGCYWALDFRRGEGDKRPRSRKIKEAQTLPRFSAEEASLYGSSRGPSMTSNAPYPSPHQSFNSSPLPGPQGYYYPQSGSHVSQPAYDSRFSVGYGTKTGPPHATGPQMRWQPTNPAHPTDMNSVTMQYMNYGNQPNFDHYPLQDPQVSYPYQGEMPSASGSSHSLQAVGHPHAPGPLPRSYPYPQYEDDARGTSDASRRHRTY